MTEASAGAPAGAPAGSSRRLGQQEREPRAVPAESGTTDASTDSTVRDSARPTLRIPPLVTRAEGETGNRIGYGRRTGVDTGPGDSGGDVCRTGASQTPGAGDVLGRGGVVETGGRGAGPRMQGLGGCWDSYRAISASHCCVKCRDEDRSLRGGLRRRCGQLPGRLLRLGGTGQLWPDSRPTRPVCCGKLGPDRRSDGCGGCASRQGFGIAMRARGGRFCPDNPPARLLTRSAPRLRASLVLSDK